MSVRIIAEIGSCHMGKVSYGKEAVERCLEMGVDAIKFQLFPNEKKFTESGNVWLSPEKYLEIAEYSVDSGLVCSASVFDEANFDFLLKTRPDFIKFSYSQKHRNSLIEECILEGIEPVVSCDIMSDLDVPEEATKLFCIPQYPVYFNVNFDGIFPRFDGFSDHTLHYEQTLEAVRSGATTIEKHMKLTRRDVTCPDSFFALSPGDFACMVSMIRRIEK